MQSITDFLIDLAGSENLWIVEIFVVTFGTLVAALLVGRLIKSLTRRSAKTRNLWDDALFESLLSPAKVMVWLVGLAFAAELAADRAETPLLAIVPVLRRVGTILVFAWFLVSLIGKLEINLKSDRYTHKPMDPTTAAAIGKLLRISVVITALLVTLQSLGYSISGVLAFGGIGGIAVGFAAKDLLANFFGGLMIYLDRPFRVGEWIRSPDKEIEGTVEEIGWRLTRIRTFDKRPLYIPNSLFAQIAVENPSRMTNRRIYETIGVRYDDAAKIDAIVNAVRAMIEAHPDLDQRQTVIVNFNRFAESSLDFFVYCFTKTTEWVAYHRIKQDVLLQIVGIIEAHDAQCAFPTATLHLPEPVRFSAAEQQHLSAAD